MLKIKDVSHVIASYGPAIGHPLLTIELEPTEDENEKPEGLIDSLKKLLSEKDLDAAYQRAIDGKLETYILFKGDIFEYKNIEVYRKLMTDISTESALLQKDLLSQGKITVDKLRPPFYMWEGIPTRFTAVHNSEKENIPSSAYDDFNVPYAVITKDCDYAPLALQQLMNNPFGTVFIKWDGEDSKEFIEEIRTMFNGFKAFILVDYDKKDNAAKFALENGYSMYVKF